MTILEHGYLDAARDWQFFDLSSPFNRVYFVVEGKGSIFNDRSAVSIEDGHVYLVPMGQSFNYVCDEHMVMMYVHFRMELLEGNDIFDGYKHCCKKPLSKEICQELIDKAGTTELGNLMWCKGLIYSQIGLLAEPVANQMKDHVKLRDGYSEVFSYVKKNCYADLRIKDIAASMKVNPSTLSKGFKNSTGMTLKDYIDSKVLQATQDALLTSDATIKVIAYRFRFSDEFRFSRFFKKHVGISPSLYRSRNNTLK